VFKDIPTIALDDLIKNYDVFFVDQFGVLRDDSGPYPQAIEALSKLKRAGKTVVLLSNSGRSGDYNAQRLLALGFERASFDRFVTSGDVAYDILSRAESPVRPGAKCLTISSGGDRNLADALGLISIDDALSADLIIISGSEAERIEMATYRKMLEPAAARQLPCFCTNPDIHKLANGAIAPGAGSIAKIYEELGGRVTWLGKPHPEIYNYALSRVGNPQRHRVMCIGDSIEHDILGARQSNLASTLVRTGILADNSLEELSALMAAIEARPTYMLPSFKP
jgi:HAD superfamily hydrolase (TIGR01459 family)